MIQLWTHHRKEFPLSDPNLVIDPTKGRYWRPMGRGFRYSEVAPKLWKLIGTDQIVWCYCKRQSFTDQAVELIEWEICVPDRSQLVFYRWNQWEDLVWSRSDDWDDLIVDGPSGPDIEAAIKLPLRPEWIKCHGPLPRRYITNTVS